MATPAIMPPFSAAPRKHYRLIERAMRFDQTDRRHSVFFFFGGFAEMLLGRTEVAD